MKPNLATVWIAAAFAVLAATGPALAQTMPSQTMPSQARPGQTMPGMGHSATGAAATAPSSQAYQDAMAKMHQAMAAPLTGNPDRDFVTGMIGHHQGAIDMANVELRYGKDKQMRKLAQSIIKAQEKEIATMRAWLAKHPG